MKEFKKTKSLCCVLKEMPIGEQIIVDNRQTKTGYVRKLVCYLKKQGYIYHATEKGLINKILVTRIK
jgi:hypothetical protein